MPKRWFLVITMMLVTLQAFAVAADVHALTPVEHTADEALSSSAVMVDKHGHEHHNSQCESKCQTCCHHGFFHVLMPQTATTHYSSAPAPAAPYDAVFSSLPTPVLFRPPKS